MTAGPDKIPSLLMVGVIKPTPVQWLPILNHISHPYLQQIKAPTPEYKKKWDNRNLTIHQDVENADEETFNVIDEWSQKLIAK